MRIGTWDLLGSPAKAMLPCDIIWGNYNDLTATSLESWLVREIIPKWPYFRLVNYYNLPRYHEKRMQELYMGCTLWLNGIVSVILHLGFPPKLTNSISVPSLNDSLTLVCSTLDFGSQKAYLYVSSKKHMSVRVSHHFSSIVHIFRPIPWVQRHSSAMAPWPCVASGARCVARSASRRRRCKAWQRRYMQRAQRAQRGSWDS